MTSGGSSCAGRVEPLLDGVDHLDRVHARLPLHQQDDGRLAVEAGQRAAFLGQVDRFAQVANPHRHVVDGRHDELVEIARIGHAAERAQAQLAVAGVDAAAGNVGVLRDDRIVDLHDRRAVGGQLGGVDVDLDRPLDGAFDDHLARRRGPTRSCFSRSDRR